MLSKLFICVYLNKWHDSGQDPQFTCANWRYAFQYPNPVNETEVRIHHAVTFGQLILGLFIDNYFSGFAALPIHITVTLFSICRFLSGPRFDPLSHLVIFGLHHYIVHVKHWMQLRFAAGPPQRFAQFIAALTALLALLARFIVYEHSPIISYYIWGILMIQLILHIVYDLCIGLGIFYLLMKLGLIPEPWIRQCKFNYEMEDLDDPLVQKRIRKSSLAAQIIQYKRQVVGTSTNSANVHETGTPSGNKLVRSFYR